MLEQEVMVVQHFAEFRREVLPNKQVGHAQSAARDLVLVGWAYAATGGADSGLALGLFAREIEGRMRRQYQWTAGTDAQAFEYGYAVCHQRIRFVDQRIEREDHPVTDQAAHPVAQDA